MFKKDEKVRLIGPKLPTKQEPQNWTDSKGTKFSVYWTELRKEYVGSVGEVKIEPDSSGMMTVIFYKSNEDDPFFMDKITFTMHYEWFREPYASPPVCTCSINQLMIAGCKCGQMERERNG